MLPRRPAGPSAVPPLPRWNMPVRLTAMTRSHSAGSSRGEFRRADPAQSTSTSSRPNSRTVAPRRHRPRRGRAHRGDRERPAAGGADPRGDGFAAVPSMSAHATAAPSRANASAPAPPMPPPAPPPAPLFRRPGHRVPPAVRIGTIAQPRLDGRVEPATNDLGIRNRRGPIFRSWPARAGITEAGNASEHQL